MPFRIPYCLPGAPVNAWLSGPVESSAATHAPLVRQTLIAGFVLTVKELKNRQYGSFRWAITAMKYLRADGEGVDA